MEIVQPVKKMQDLALELRRQGKRLALVPTMGALHEGHLKLVDVARQLSDVVIMSVFVNPAQFGPQEDFQRYPRDLERDRKLAEARGVDIYFTPVAEEIYPPAHQTFVVVTELTRGLCGPSRPGHFRGVATVVAALFLLTQPNVAVFGEKDYQQLAILKRMAKDLHFPIHIVGVPTVREPDGLAMSSRNVYLSAADRKEALNLFKSISAAQASLKKGQRQAGEIHSEVKKILQHGPSIQVEYISIVDAESLEEMEKVDRLARLAMAVQIHGTRLIDNGPLEP